MVLFKASFKSIFSFSDTIRVISEKEYKSFPNDTIICQTGKPITLSLNIPAQYKWSTGATSNAIEVKNAGIYSVTLTTPQCQLQFSTVVKTENCLCNFYAPNSFSPNGDGVNDGFKPFVQCKLVSIKDYQLSIFNRFGNLVFTTNDPNAQWDGTYRGKDCDTGVFAWVVKYKVNSDRDVGIDTFVESGDVTIVR